MPIVDLACLAAGNTFSAYAISILAVGVLIFVHELGHFLACRATKTRVETFSIGFGPRLLGWETKDGVRRFTVGSRREDAALGSMDVRLSVIPLGGYVKMAGENPGERKTGASDEYPSKPFSARLFIITAGVIMNALSAVAFSAIGYGAGAKEAPPIVGTVGEGPASRAGLRAGDRVKAVDGDPVRSFEELRARIVYMRSGQDVTLDVERGGKPLALRVRAEYDAEFGAPHINVGPTSTWTPDDGHGPFAVGPEERVVVAGSYAHGGSAAAHAANLAVTRGDRTARVEFLDKPGTPPRDLDLTHAYVPAEKPAYKLGVVQRASRVVGWVRTAGPAEVAGIRVGDEVVEVDGKPLDPRTGLWLVPSIGSLVLKREGSAPVTVRVDAKDPLAVADFLAAIELKGSDDLVVDVEGGGIEGGESPAAKAGIKSGDRIAAIGDKPVGSWKDLIAEGRNLTEKPVLVRVQRGSEPPFDVSVTPKPGLDRSPKIFVAETYRVEVQVSGVFGAVSMAVSRTLREMGDVFRTIRSFVSGDVSADKNLGGPGTLVMISAQSYADGWGTFLLFLAFISVQLCILNILPIPVLDGGHLLFLVIEKIKGSPVRETTIAKAQIVGMVLLLGLMYFAVRNDIRFGSR